MDEGRGYASRAGSPVSGGPSLAGDLIGRHAELESVLAAIREDRAIAVVGEAGIGKTALVRAAASASGRRLHEGGGFATLATMPYLALSRATGRPLAGDPAVAAPLVEQTVGPNILFIDDLHWTDAATREVIQQLTDRIAIIVAVRAGDPGTRGALEPLEVRGVTVVRVAGLDDEAAMALARRHGASVATSRLREVVDLAGGNPLIIEELTLRGSTSSSLTRAILGQVEALLPSDRAALELLAVADRPLPWTAVGAAGSRLVALGLVDASAEGLAVRHNLIAQAVVGEIAAARRRAIHGRLSELIEEPSERARHLAAAGRHEAAFALASSAVTSAADPATRAALMAVAAETAGGDASTWRVRAALEFRGIGRPLEAIAMLQAPLDGDDDLRALGASVLAGSLDHEGRNEEALEVIAGAQGLRPVPGGEAAVELAVIEGVVLVNAGRLEEAIAVAERAAAANDEAPRRYRLAGHLAALRLYAGGTDRLEPLQEAIAGALAAGDGGAAAGRALDLYYMTLALEGAAPAVAIALDSAEHLEALGYHTRAAELRAESAQASIFTGELAATVLRVDSMLEQPLGVVSRHRLQYNRGLALGLLGRIDDAERTLAEVEPVASPSFDGRGSVLWCWAEVALWSGRPERALELAEASLAFTAFNEAEFVLPSLTRAWAEYELGGTPSPATVDVPFQALAGAGPELRGLNALAAGEMRAAALAFDEAAERWAGFHVPRELLCRWAAGEARRRAGQGDAVPRLQEAMRDAAAIGFEPLAARARRSLRLAGERPAPATPRQPGSGLLTAREREVLDLVSRGLTNAEIARRMSLGRPTVARLLSNAMLKLGAESRAHAINLAAQLA